MPRIFLNQVVHWHDMDPYKGEQKQTPSNGYEVSVLRETQEGIQLGMTFLRT
jgi:hypothetical protein